MVRNQRDEPSFFGISDAWTTTNVTTDRSIDANGAVAVIGDGLCTLIEDLKAAGVLL